MPCQHTTGSHGAFCPLHVPFSNCYDWGNPTRVRWFFCQNFEPASSFSNHEVSRLTKIAIFPLCLCNYHLTMLTLNTGQSDTKMNLGTVFSVLTLSCRNEMLMMLLPNIVFDHYPRLFYLKFRTRLTGDSMTWNFPRLSIIFCKLKQNVGDGTTSVNSLQYNCTTRLYSPSLEGMAGSIQQ